MYYLVVYITNGVSLIWLKYCIASSGLVVRSMECWVDAIVLLLTNSKKLANHIGAMKLFICHYNLTKASAFHGAHYLTTRTPPLSQSGIPPQWALNHNS